jgi:hypothetical protein
MLNNCKVVYPVLDVEVQCKAVNVEAPCLKKSHDSLRQSVITDEAVTIILFCHGTNMIRHESAVLILFNLVDVPVGIN